MKNTIQLFLVMFFVVQLSVSAQNAAVNLDESSKIDELIELKSKLTQENKLGNRYKIQLGSFSSMKSAEEVLKKFKSEYAELPADLEYEAPNYKVWVGDFTSRLAAERVFLKMKKKYKSAFVFKPNGR